MRVRWTNAASISIAVVLYQADLRSRVAGKDPLASGVLTCGAAEQGVFSGLDLLLAPRAEPRVGDANLDGPGGRRRLASSERDV